jgi:hypothetical protein
VRTAAIVIGLVLVALLIVIIVLAIRQIDAGRRR